MIAVNHIIQFEPKYLLHSLKYSYIPMFNVQEHMENYKLIDFAFITIDSEESWIEFG